IEYLYFYNGGGVACGDINNDGLVDIYFSSNQQSNKLYLNKGNFKFQDITEKSGTQGIGNWKTGVTMADVNGDGYLDIFVCGVGNYKGFTSRNQLLVNNKDLTFSDKTEEYGLAFKGFSTQTVFFDFDLDGDLDCYLLNHSVHSASSYVAVSNRVKTDSLSGDQLFRNDLIVDGKNTGNVKFLNVTRSAGILSSRLGYGLVVSVSDVNLDGYPDIYVSNDFQENDYLYLNNKNGTFKQALEQALAHSSRFSMGNDIADFNNDLRPDVITTDMLPRDEAVIKTSAGEDAFEVFKYKLKFGYHYQVARNCLQLNQFISDSTIAFSDVAPLAGVEATDWSWSPLLVDFDNDGWKDLFISNGIVRRPNDLDYINFISNQAIQDSLKTIEQSDLKILDSMPEGKVSNFVFKNNGGLKFEDVSSKWGINLPSFSTGSAFADLDNDGDFDLVVNNINENAFIYQNNSNFSSGKVIINLNGSDANTFGVGTKVIAFAGAEKRIYEASNTRGFCSSSDSRIIIGLGSASILDSLLVIWPNGLYDIKRNINSGQHLQLVQSNSKALFNFNSLLPKRQLFNPVRKEEMPNFFHQEDDYNAFNNEGLIPHMLTTQGPALSCGDVNSDGLQDVFIGGAKDQPSAIYLQLKNGSWSKQKCNDLDADLAAEDVASQFFDADADGDLDLFVAGGGQNPQIRPEFLQPRLYTNDGKGNFSRDRRAIPDILLNASTVKSADYDLDGDVDVFIGSSVLPFLYGMSPISYLLANDGKGNFSVMQNWLGQSRFDNPTQFRPGMVKDAVWCDVNRDALPDLILVGEWMPITVLVQTKEHLFENLTDKWGLKATSGWWNTIAARDFDGDGDEDFIVGNLGENSRLHVSEKKPLTMYLGDFDSNGGSDHVLIYYNGQNSYPFASRDQLVKQLPGLKKKFLKYSDYRNVVLEDIV
ncbi:MAG: CRTAC1 family protein, partial [Cytophagales bacterium]